MRDADLCAAFRGARVLITGAGGFIGRHLTSALQALQANTVLVGPSTNACDNVQRISVGDTEFARFLRRAGPVDYVFHLAARTSATASVADPYFDFTANLATTVGMLEQLRLLGWRSRVVVASSAAVYGSPSKLPIEETDPTLPRSPYGLSKLAMEQYAALYARVYGLSTACVRPFSVYGPYQTKQVVYALFQQLEMSPRELTLLGDGTQVRDLVYVADVARAFLIVAAGGRADGSAYNVATGVSTTLGQLAQQIIRIQGANATVTFSGLNRMGDQDRLVGSSARLTALGGAPRCGLYEGLLRTARWFNLSQTHRTEQVAGRPEVALR
jgi:UDP-glucose 4-epimerase